MNRARFYVLVSIALAVAVFVPWLGTHAQTQANSKVEFIHTGDWQSGDKVSFTIRGEVVDNPTAENNQPQPTQSQSSAGATLQGYVVDMEDPKGNKTQIPWTPLIEYSVPNVEGPITATVIGPGGAQIGTAQIPVYNAGTSIPMQLPTQSSETLVAPPISQIGQTYKVYSPSGALSGQGDATLIAGGGSGSAPIETKALAESPHSAVFEPTGLKPGSTTFTIKEGPALQASFTVSVIGIGLDTRRLQTRGQAGTLILQVAGFPTDPDALHKLMASNPVVNLVNQTPNILAFTQSPPHITWTVHESEVQNGMWTQNIPTVAQQRGQFQMTATVTTSVLTNPSSSAGVAQYQQQPSSATGSNQQQNPPTATGNTQSVSTQQTNSQSQQTSVTATTSASANPSSSAGVVQYGNPSSATATTSVSTNPSSSAGAAQYQQPSSAAGSITEQNPSTATGNARFASVQQTSGQNHQQAAGQGSQFQISAAATTSPSTNSSSSAGAAQYQQPPATGSKEENQQPIETGEEQFVLADNSGGGGGMANTGGGGCPQNWVFMRGKLSQEGNMAYFTDEATGAKFPLPLGAPGRKPGDTVGICFNPGIKANPANNRGLAINRTFYQLFADNPVWGDARFIPGRVYKDKDGNYWVEDFRTGLKYQLDKDNCDPDALIARQEKDAAAAKEAKKDPPTFEEKEAAYWKWLRAKIIHDAWEKKKQLFDDWRAAKKEWDADNPNKPFAVKPPVAPDANEPPKPGEERPYPGVKGTIEPPAKAGEFPKIRCKDVKIGALSPPAREGCGIGIQPAQFGIASPPARRERPSIPMMQSLEGSRATCLSFDRQGRVSKVNLTIRISEL